MTPTKKEMYVMGFVWVVALCAIFFSYISAANKKNRSKISECPVYVPTNGAVVLTECADKKGE